jgi:hypothetical protein
VTTAARRDSAPRDEAFRSSSGRRDPLTLRRADRTPTQASPSETLRVLRAVAGAFPSARERRCARSARGGGSCSHSALARGAGTPRQCPQYPRSRLSYPLLLPPPSRSRAAPNYRSELLVLANYHRCRLPKPVHVRRPWARSKPLAFSASGPPMEPGRRPTGPLGDADRGSRPQTTRLRPLWSFSGAQRSTALPTCAGSPLIRAAFGVCPAVRTSIVELVEI